MAIAIFNIVVVVQFISCYFKYQLSKSTLLLIIEIAIKLNYTFLPLNSPNALSIAFFVTNIHLIQHLKPLNVKSVSHLALLLKPRTKSFHVLFYIVLSSGWIANKRFNSSFWFEKQLL
jgi:hypothetical protein